MRIIKAVFPDGRIEFHIGIDGWNYVDSHLYSVLDIDALCIRMKVENLSVLYVEIETYGTKPSPNEFIFDRTFSIVDKCVIIPSNPIIVAIRDDSSNDSFVLDNRVSNNVGFDIIDGFDHGYARVHRNEFHIIYNSKTKILPAGWGIINKNGEEVVPISDKYEIRKFYGEGSKGTYVISNDGTKDIYRWFDFKTGELLDSSPAYDTVYWGRDVNRSLYLLSDDWNKTDEDEDNYEYDKDFSGDDGLKSTSTGEEWEIDSDGIEYIPHWLQD